MMENLSKDRKITADRVITAAGVVIAALLTFLDQLTKSIAVEKLKNGPFVLIDGVFEFSYISNHGAAWGILSGQRFFFLIVTLIVMGLIIYVYFKTPKIKKYLGIIICEILLFSGALGNFIDRFLLGYVRDFLYFSLIDFPIFNVADCYVVISAVCLCILVVFVYKDEDFSFLTFKKNKGE